MLVLRENTPRISIQIFKTIWNFLTQKPVKDTVVSRYFSYIYISFVIWKVELPYVFDIANNPGIGTKMQGSDKTYERTLRLQVNTSVFSSVSMWFMYVNI